MGESDGAEVNHAELNVIVVPSPVSSSLSVLSASRVELSRVESSRGAMVTVNSGRRSLRRYCDL